MTDPGRREELALRLAEERVRQVVDLAAQRATLVAKLKNEAKVI